MSTLEHTVYQIRRGWRFSSVFLFAGAFAAIFACGSFSMAWEETTNRLAVILLFIAWALVFGVKAHRRFSNYKTSKRQWRERDDLELGLLLVVGTYGAVQAAGGLSSVVYPIVFVLVAFLVVYTPQWVGFTLVGTAIGVEVTLALFNPLGVSLETAVIHGIFIIFFALINLVFTRTEVARMRRRTEQLMAETRAAMADDARDFRLIAPARSSGWHMNRQEEVERLAHSSMSQLKGAMFHHVDLLKRTLGLNTCAVLWLDARGEFLRVRECLSDTENIVTQPFDKGEGALGAVIQNRKPLRLEHLRPNYKGLTYYAEPTPVTDFIGMPILEGGIIRGVLAGDRLDGRPFSVDEVEIFEASVESLLNVISNERVFNQLQKAKSEQGKLLGASETLSKTLSEKDVIKAALKAAAEIVNFDIGVLTSISTEGHNIRHAVGPRSADLLKQPVSVSSSLVSAAIKNRHYLPYRGEFDPKQQVLMSKRSQKFFSKMRSAMVLPLFSGETPLGSLVLASGQERLFDDEIRTTLQVMTNQLGTVLENARMYQKLEALATTDGLTGLPNHRVFQDELERRLASAVRFNNKLSVVFCDVDKFKGVNDTYGHPVGDMVLRGLSSILKQDVVRDTDMAARYGGEEFAIVLEGTDTEGAFKLANRIRKDLEQAIFHTELGKLKVTISMGVATYPDHAETKADLVERADIALYAAKEGGRNQVRTFEKPMIGEKVA
jgi:two-component system, cell cycle response regulator